MKSANRIGLKLRKPINYNENNFLNRKLKNPNQKKKKSKSTRKKDEENILSKDIDVEEEMKELERMNENRGLKPRDISNINYSKNYLKNLKFRPQKYKGNYLPYHLRWIFNNSVKSNEIVLIQEIEALESEINRLKQIKQLNRDNRKIANFPFGLSTSVCTCCKKIEKKKHECTHQYCDKNCIRKKNNTCPQAFINPYLRKKLIPGIKGRIFGLVERSKDPELNEKKPFVITN